MTYLCEKTLAHVAHSKVQRGGQQLMRFVSEKHACRARDYIHYSCVLSLKLLRMRAENLLLRVHVYMYCSI